MLVVLIFDNAGWALLPFIQFVLFKYGENMPSLEDVKKLLIGSPDNPPVRFTVVGPCAEIEFKSGDVLKFSRNHGGTADWFTVKLNSKVVYQG